MSPEERRKLFTVVTNSDYDKKESIPEKSLSSYQTNPLTEKLAKFVNSQSEKKFSVQELLKW